MLREFLTFGALGLTSLAAVSAYASDGTGQVRASVVGDASGPDDDAVVFLITPAAACSAVLVAANLVVTTHQCVAREGRTVGFVCNADGELENRGTGAGEIGEDFPPEQISIYLGEVPGSEPDAFGRQVVATGSTTVCQDDLAFVVLDRKLSNAPTRAIRQKGEIRIGELVTMVGYGGPRALQRQRRAEVPVLDVDVPPRTFATGPGACGGDSGGPALSSETGAVLGVLSVLSGSCGADSSGALYTRLDAAAFQPLTQAAFEIAGAKPEQEQKATGEGAPHAGCSVRATRRSFDVSAEAALLTLLTLCRRRYHLRAAHAQPKAGRLLPFASRKVVNLRSGGST